MGSVPYVVEDCMGVLQVLSDGSIHRDDDVVYNFPFNFPTPENDVGFKDVVFDPELGLHLRLYIPNINKSKVKVKVAVVVYLHGGGFCVGSAAWPNCHNSCLRLAAALGALVVAPEYRLAPESRLPAAMEDAVRALEWVGEAELELEGADLGRVFVVGDSSGGNIGHHMAVTRMHVRVRVRGYVLLAPFFGGEERTESETRATESMLTLDMLDRFWRLSLPKGETRDHPYANPFGPNSPNLESVPMEPMLVIVGGNELLKDRVKDYYNNLKALGKNIQFLQFQGLHHGFFTNDPYSQVSDQLLQKINNFMSENSS